MYIFEIQGFYESSTPSGYVDAVEHVCEMKLWEMSASLFCGGVVPLCAGY